MEYEWIIYEKEDGIATLTLNRPDRLNAWIPPMRVEARKCIEDAAADSSVRVLIVTGAGRAFCSGGDVGTVASGTEAADDEPPRQRLMLPVSTVRLMDALRSLNKPTIAAVNGIAAGSGIAFALACDVIIASEMARLRLAFTRMGVVPADGITWLLTRAIGTHRALELAYTNDIIDATEMERIGVVNRVVPHDELMKTAKDMAKRMTQIPPLTLAMTKKAIYHSTGTSNLEDQIVFEHAAGSAIRNTEDSKEATRSFIEKRQPLYQGQ